VVSSGWSRPFPAANRTRTVFTPSIPRLIEAEMRTGLTRSSAAGPAHSAPRCEAATPRRRE
jgi:hypothetical protein